MSTLHRSNRRPVVPARARPVARFANRRTRSWPCPSPARFSILYMYDLHDIVLQLSGALDAVEARTFADCVDEAISEHPRRLIVEMSALDTMDDAGLSSVIHARDRTVVADVDFILDLPGAPITEMLDRAGVRESFFIR